MKILLLHGRLDTQFKNFGQVVAKKKDYSNLPAIRKPWAACYELLKAYGHEVDEYIIPVWKITEELFHDETFSDWDKIIVPHRQKEQFKNLPSDITDKMLFLMQTVFPERFTLDSKGWGANLSFLPLDGPVWEEDVPFFKRLQERVANNVSKFEQPEFLPGVDHHTHYDVLFVCQLPHDETIKFHSDITVEYALHLVLEEAKTNGWSVLVKGHPVNPGSMEPLKKIASFYRNVLFTDQISIHQAIKISDIITMVNSGVGFEAMLHEKPIFTYGRSEYQNVVNYKKPLDKEPPNVLRYRSFLNDFCNNYTLDTTNPQQFKRNLNAILGV